MSQWALFFASVLSNRRFKHILFFCTKDGGQLILLFVTALLFAFLFVGNDVTAEILFQSPQSPPPAQQEAPPPQPTPVPPTPVPTEPPPPEPTATQPPPAAEGSTEEPTPQPEATPLPEPTATPVPPTEAAPTEEPPSAELTDTQPPSSSEAQSSTDLPTRVEVRRGDVSLDFEGDTAPSFILDQAELIDAVAVSGAYIWLCCGVGLFLLAPLFFLILYVRGRSQIIQE